MDDYRTRLETDPDVRSVAFALLLNQEVYGTRRVAEHLDWNVERVVPAMVALQEDLLATHEGHPINPNLFNALAASWCTDQPTVGLAKEPMPGNRKMTDALMLGLDDPEREPGWALGGKHAAALWRVPVGNVNDIPHHFYIPSEVYLRVAEKELGIASGGGVRAVVRTTPMYWITGHRIDAASRGFSNSHWPIVHPLVTALEVAAEDRSLLDAWTDVPAEVNHRPWN